MLGAGARNAGSRDSERARRRSRRTSETSAKEETGKMSAIRECGSPVQRNEQLGHIKIAPWVLHARDRLLFGCLCVGLCSNRPRAPPEPFAHERMRVSSSRWQAGLSCISCSLAAL